MTAPGDATSVGSIVGYLVLNRNDWTRGVRDTERDSDRLGRLSPTIRIGDNAAEVIGRLELVHAAERKVGSGAAEAKPFVMNLYAALAAVAPAAVPIAAVAGGALLGLLPVAAAVSLGVKGISKDMKSGALAGTQYGQDINFLKGYLSQLQQTAAGGLLNGLDQALASSKPLFGAINQDIGVFSNQLGDIVAGAAPALLTILTQLAPLFTTIGGEVAKGATALEHWAQSSDGVSKFVAYVQQELPDVEHILGNVITLVGHLLQGAAPSGGALLHDLNVLTDALDAIPVNVLAVAIPLAISFYAALKTGQGVAAIVTGINKAVTATGEALALTGPKADAAAAQQVAASAEVAAAHAAEAVEVQRAALQIAEAEEAKQRAAMQWGAAADETATIVAAAARAEMASLEASAATAQETADVKIAAARAAATASEESAAASGAGFASMLGPLAGVAIGVGLLSTLLIGNHDAAERAAQAQQSYADSLKKTTDMLAAVNVQTTIDDLSKAKAYDQLDALTKANGNLGLSYGDLANAVNGNQQQYDGVIAKLTKVRDGNLDAHAAARRLSSGLDEQANHSDSLIKTLGLLRGGLHDQRQEQLATNEATRQAGLSTETAADAITKLDGAQRTATQSGALLVNQLDQFAKSQGTAADRGALIGATLKAANGDALAYAGALTSATTAVDALTGAFAQQRQQLAQQSQQQANAARSSESASARVAAAQARLNAVRSKSTSTAAQVRSAEAAVVSAQNSAATAAAKAAQSGALAYADTERAALRFRKTQDGLKASIDTSAKGAGDLVQQLQAIQDAAVAAASAEYQHEGSTKKAADDAYNIYVTKTKSALIDNRKQLDLTRGQAKALARQYLDTPAKVKTLIEAEGVNPVVTVLDKIGQLLAHLTGQQWNIAVNAHVNTQAADLIKANAHGLGATYNSQVPNYKPAHHAAGGPITGPGPNGVDSVLFMGAPGEWVVNDRAVDKLTGKYGPDAMALINRGELPAAALSRAAAQPAVMMPIRAGSPASGGVAAAQGDKHIHLHGDVNLINNYPAPERASDALPRQRRQMAETIGSFL